MDSSPVEQQKTTVKVYTISFSLKNLAKIINSVVTDIS